MLSLIDPKPFGAFIEYTLKPILDEVREILELCDKDYKSLKRAFYLSAGLFIFDRLFSFLTIILVTVIVCSTVYLILSHSPNILQ